MSNKNWISTQYRKQVHPLNLQPNEIDIRDIAHALSMICRFTGHVRQFYSVGQHSCYVALHCSKKNKLWGLLHDASEAYIADVASPVKHSKQMVAYRKIEKNIMLSICDKFGLPQEEPDEVKQVDAEMCNLEAHQLGVWNPNWPIIKGNLNFNIDKWLFKYTELSFLRLFKYYGGKK
jgi:uncharacterized protein